MNTPNPSLPHLTHHKQFAIGAVLSEAWSLVRGLKWPIFLRIVAITLIAVVMPVIGFLIFFSGMIHTPLLFAVMIPIGIIYFFLAAFFISIIMASCVLLGVRQAAGLPLDVKLVNAECTRHKWAIFGLALIAIAIDIGLRIISFLFVMVHIPGFIVSIALFFVTLYFIVPIIMFALPLVLTTNCSVGEALSSCFAMMKKYWLPVLACYFIMFVLLVISEFLLIVWIWTAPMFYAMYGIFFRDAYGLQNQRDIPVVPVKRSPLGE